MKGQRGTCSYHCELDAAFAIIGGKWKAQIVWYIGSDKRRFNELKEVLVTISPRMLSKQLHELEEDGLVIRTLYPEVPLRVEYRLTEAGRTLIPVLGAMASWVMERCPEAAGRIRKGPCRSDAAPKRAGAGPLRTDSAAK